MLPVAQQTFANMLYDKGAFGDKVLSGLITAIEALKPVPVNPPAGGDREPEKTELHRHGCDLPTSLAAIQGAFANPAGSVVLVLCGEAHLYLHARPVKAPKLTGMKLAEAQGAWDSSALDQARGQGILNTIGGAPYTPPDLILLERDMTYVVPGGLGNLARESNLTTSSRVTTPGGLPVDSGLGLKPEERGMAVAAYLFLCVAGGNQNAVDKILVLFGARHQEIFKYFEYFAAHTTLSWVRKRPRHFLSIPNHGE